MNSTNVSNPSLSKSSTQTKGRAPKKLPEFWPKIRHYLLHEMSAARASELVAQLKTKGLADSRGYVLVQVCWQLGLIEPDEEGRYRLTALGKDIKSFEHLQARARSVTKQQPRRQKKAERPPSRLLIPNDQVIRVLRDLDELLDMKEVISRIKNESLGQSSSGAIPSSVSMYYWAIGEAMERLSDDLKHDHFLEDARAFRRFISDLLSAPEGKRPLTPSGYPARLEQLERKIEALIKELHAQLPRERPLTPRDYKDTQLKGTIVKVRLPPAPPFACEACGKKVQLGAYYFVGRGQHLHGGDLHGDSENAKVYHFECALKLGLITELRDEPVHALNQG